MMQIGIQFFPAVGPEQKSGEQYWREALILTQLAETLGFSNVRTVEHYFQAYGGYSPNPLIFLAAAAAVTQKLRLTTGAVLPVFNHPLKLASELAMLDSISGGRLEIGFARAFLHSEFTRFGISLDESRSRFDEGVAQVVALLESENVTSKGRHHSYDNVTILPRPVQRPRPPVWIAALSTPDSFEAAGRHGYDMMAIPLAGSQMRPLLDIYRDARRRAGHASPGRVMLAFHMFCHEDGQRARDIACPHLDRYLQSIVEAASGWTSGASSGDYPNYDRIFASLSKETADSQISKGGAWIGTPDEIVKAIKSYTESVGDFGIASLQVNFGNLDLEDAKRSMRLFASDVMPRIA